MEKQVRNILNKFNLIIRLDFLFYFTEKSWAKLTFQLPSMKSFYLKEKKNSRFLDFLFLFVY